MLAGLENESHVADACLLRCGGSQEHPPRQSTARGDALRILCKRRHANSKLLTLQVRVHPPGR